MTVNGAFTRDHVYDIHGLVRLRSAVPLTALRYFELGTLRAATDERVDIQIGVGSVGGGPRLRRAIERVPGGVRYAEHTGRLGAAFELSFGPPFDLVVSPLLARSPHVLYTNVVEAIIRCQLAAREHALVHAATVVLDGCGVMMTALTDTGKTGTVLRLTRERGALFLSDDMTVLAPDGTALAFPKPLTISAHTLRAIGEGRGASGRASLALKSRIHSRTGRSLGQRLAAGNLPIVTINSLTQMAVPPPKRAIGDLVPGCEITRSVRLNDLFVIARGATAVTELTPGSAVATLLTNTDDAYQFPPAMELMAVLAVDGRTHGELRAKEAELVAAAVASVSARSVVCDDFSWADRLPALLGGPGLVSPPA